jgi:MFS family permease
MRTIQQWARTTTGGLPPQFWLLWTATLINRLGQFVLIFLAIYLHQQLGFSAAFTGLVLGMAGLGSALGSTIGGWLTDHWGRRRTMLLAQYAGGSVMITLGFVRQPYLMMAGVFFLGLFADAARPAFAAMVADLVPGKDRLRAFSLNYWAINLGFSCAAILAGLAARVDYLLLFLIDGGSTILTAALIIRRLRETRPTTSVAPTGGARPPNAVRVIVRDRVFLTFVALNLFTALIFLQHVSMLPIAMGNDGVSASTFGTVIALNGVMIVFGQLFVPRLIKRRSSSRVLALAAVLVGAGFGLTAFAHTPLLYAGTVFVWTLGEMLNAPSNSTMIAALSPVTMRGRYQGVFSLSWSAAAFTAPILGGWIYGRFGGAALWLGCLAVALVAAVVQLISGPARERQAARLHSNATTAVWAPPIPAVDEEAMSPAAA